VVICKDTVGGNINHFEMPVKVPRIDPDTLSSSTLVLADIIQNVSHREIGMGQFTIGGTKVRPRIGETFRRDENLGIYMKVYNLLVDEQTRKPQGQVLYEVFKTGTAEPLVSGTDDLSKLQDANTNVVLEKFLPLEQFAPGSYTLRLKITDKIRDKVLTQTATFKVT